jgi:hypothetical protein
MYQQTTEIRTHWREQLKNRWEFFFSWWLFVFRKGMVQAGVDKPFKAFSSVSEKALLLGELLT